MRQALGVAILSVNVRDTQGFFEHCEYGILGFPRRAPPLYNLASSNRSGSEPAGANIRNLKAVFAERESDAGEIISARPPNARGEGGVREGPDLLLRP